MNQLEQQLYKAGIFKLTVKRVRNWAKQGKVDHLIFASQKGLFNIRLEACHHLKSYVSAEKVKVALIALVKDPVPIVGNAAIDVLKPLGHRHYDQLIQKVLEERNRKKLLEEELRKRAKLNRGREDYPSLGEIYYRSRGRYAPDLSSGGFGGIGMDGGIGF